MRFWDASAVVPLLLVDDSSASMRALVEDDGAMLVWWGTLVECTSAVARREREGDLTPGGAAQALESLGALSRSWHELLPSDVVRRTAQRLLRVHPLRAADALQLAAAIVAAEHDPASLELVGLDERLNDAAQREGFRVLAS